ncbi:YcxB family protein [Streptomyces sp. NPDC001820]|uniref:YcxB family protein n=1 Tax=Streptomyces sp. NPDC001820 TaxID=3364613 RepID=UPI0036D14A17
MQETSAVELAYLPTTADAVGALRARMRATPAGRLQNGVLLAGAVVVLGALVLNFAAPGEPSLRSTVVCLAALAVLGGLYGLIPTLQGRQVHRMLAPQGEFQAVVDDGGVRVTSRDSETTYRWPMLTRYAETDELFVLLTPDKYGVGLVVLPKRGAAEPADADRLRAVLDRNATRI